MTRSRSAVGFTVKSGWAAVVLITGSAADPTVADSVTVHLSDPAEPDSRQPYHAGFGTAREGGAELTRLVRLVNQYGRRSIKATIRRYAAGGHRLRGAGLVVGSLIDPATIGNDHIRIHALEGRLFRTVVERGASAQGLPCEVWRERDLYSIASETLKKPEPLVRRTLAAIGRSADGPWRVEQKNAALAAWLVLARSSRRRRQES